LNKRRQQFIRVRNETFSVVAMCVCIQIVRPLESIPGCAPFRRHWRNPHAFIWRFRAGFPALHQWKGIFKMKTFIVYDLDSQIPAAVGEQVSAETARYCASVTTGISPANLLAEEIDLQKQITY
jgi:hypothetical protein